MMTIRLMMLTTSTTVVMTWEFCEYSVHDDNDDWYDDGDDHRRRLCRAARARAPPITNKRLWHQSSVIDIFCSLPNILDPPIYLTSLRQWRWPTDLEIVCDATTEEWNGWKETKRLFDDTFQVLQFFYVIHRHTTIRITCQTNFVHQLVDAPENLEQFD